RSKSAFNVYPVFIVLSSFLYLIVCISSTVESKASTPSIIPLDDDSLDLEDDIPLKAAPSPKKLGIFNGTNTFFPVDVELLFVRVAEVWKPTEVLKPIKTSPAESSSSVPRLLPLLAPKRYSVKNLIRWISSTSPC
ncbi:hypothetical protein U1Q18_047808, partial [Sarracenia purpurea var. burkii]